jgi:hypothetical protein
MFDFLNLGQLLGTTCEGEWVTKGVHNPVPHALIPPNLLAHKEPDTFGGVSGPRPDWHPKARSLSEPRRGSHVLLTLIMWEGCGAIVKSSESFRLPWRNLG